MDIAHNPGSWEGPALPAREYLEIKRKQSFPLSLRGGFHNAAGPGGSGGGQAPRNPAGPVFALAFVVVLASVLSASPALARPTPCTSSVTCRAELNLSSGGTIPYYRSVPLVRNDLIQRAVLVVHGNGRDADRYYDRAVAAASSESDFQDLVIIAPNFRTRGDKPAPREHYWSSRGWKIGNKSLDVSRISSFTAMNELMARLCSAEPAIFPKLKVIVVIGHSAGGQFVNRYAAGATPCLNHAIEVRYVVMNPSSYLYLDERRRPAGTGAFELVASHCRDYDEYKYGLRHLNSYMRGVGEEKLRAQLQTRPTYYLAGGEDTRGGSSLDTSCAARLQGPNRLARFANYRDYTRLFPHWTGAAFIVVPGVGHDGGRMLGSEAARRIMFR
jgi:pimeloyl-ACP methyl ester carboxylesterase